MRNEQFYSTAAQVLPTLVIAIVIEVAARYRVFWEYLTAASRRHDEAQHRYFEKSASGVSEPELRQAERDWKQAEQVLLNVNRTIPDQPELKIALALAVVFLLGEIGSLFVLFVGTGGWLPTVAGPVALAAMILLSLASIVLPFLRPVPRAAWLGASLKDALPTVEHAGGHCRDASSACG
jgi:hypothetical protein